MGSCVKEGRTAGPSAALGMTKGSEVTFIKSCQMDRKKLQLRSWLGRRDDKEERVTGMGSCAGEGRTAGPSASLGMTRGAR
jgi:hypothetical protein